MELDYRDLVTVEWCSTCEEESVILAVGESICPVCGERLLPCSMCDNRECRDCPY